MKYYFRAFFALSLMAPIWDSYSASVDMRASYEAYKQKGGAATGAFVRALIDKELTGVAAFVYLKALSSGKDSEIASVTPYTRELVNSEGIDIFQPFIVKYTKPKHYTNVSRDYFLYVVGKYLIHRGQFDKSIQYLSRINADSEVYPFGMFLLGTAQLLLGRVADGTAAFQECVDTSSRVRSKGYSSEGDSVDLRNRCLLGIGRGYYQAREFEKAYSAFDEVELTSLAWADALVESAWVAYSIQDYNRALGKLVTYKAPLLSFYFDPEVELLRGLSYNQMCRFGDVDKVLKEFRDKYYASGLELKRFIQTNRGNPESFFSEGKKSYMAPRFNSSNMNRILQKFTKTPYYSKIVAVDRAVDKQMDRLPSVLGLGTDSSTGRFFSEVLSWRKKKNTEIGGRFLENATYQMYKSLVIYFDQIAFIRLENIRKEKQDLQGGGTGLLTKGSPVGETPAPKRLDHQQLYKFNGEFWADELGNYVFALKSECK